MSKGAQLTIFPGSAVPEGMTNRDSPSHLYLAVTARRFRRSTASRGTRSRRSGCRTHLTNLPSFTGTRSRNLPAGRPNQNRHPKRPQSHPPGHPNLRKGEAAVHPDRLENLLPGLQEAEIVTPPDRVVRNLRNVHPPLQNRQNQAGRGDGMTVMEKVRLRIPTTGNGLRVVSRRRRVPDEPNRPHQPGQRWRLPRVSLTT